MQYRFAVIWGHSALRIITVRDIFSNEFSNFHNTNRFIMQENSTCPVCSINLVFVLLIRRISMACSQERAMFCGEVNDESISEGIV